MAYTRTYPIADNRLYSPGANPLLSQKATMTATSNIITNIRTDYISTMTTGWVATDWFVKIKSAADNSDVGSYRVTATGANSITLQKMNGTAFSATASGDCTISIFNKNTPSAWDRVPEAILVTTAPGANVTGITADGQYFDIAPAAFVASAIYNISIREIISAGGMSGYLLGSAGMNGSPL